MLKNKWVSFLLCLFFGVLGAHKFYLGKTGIGFLYLIFCWSGIPAFISLFEALTIWEGLLFQKRLEGQCESVKETRC